MKTTNKEIENNINTNNFDEDVIQIDWISIITKLWKNKKLIILTSVVGFVLAITISFLIKPTYQSTTVILPDTDKSKLSSLGGLSDLASLAGINVGSDGAIIKLYPTIIKSESVLKHVIYHKYKVEDLQDSVNLIQYWEIKKDNEAENLETALKKLKDMLNVSMDNKTNVLTINIETTDANLSADILNLLALELDKYITTKRNTNASEQKKWIDSRLEDINRDLKISENNLKLFREKNVRIESPQLKLEEQRLLREVQINSTLYLELRKQLEIAKIEEIKNIPIINIMDKAVPATKKTSPKRAMYALVGLFLSVSCIVGYVLIKDKAEEYLKTLKPIFKN